MMQRKARLLIVIAALATLILSACDLLTLDAKVINPDKPAAEPGDAPTPTLDMPTASAFTESPPTAAPAAPDNLSAVTFEGGGFTYDESLAADAVVAMAPASTAGLPGEMVAPEHVAITFDG